MLMVCLGNICRSPMAEGILRQCASQARIKMEIDSAGTGNYHIGEAPDHRAIACARAHGVDISGLRARQFVRRDFQEFDLIYVMDASNYADVMKLAANDGERSKVKLMLNEAWPNENRPVPDPWFGDLDGFEQVFHMLQKASDAIVRRYKENQG